MIQMPVDVLKMMDYLPWRLFRQRRKKQWGAMLYVMRRLRRLATYWYSSLLRVTDQRSVESGDALI